MIDPDLPNILGISAAQLALVHTATRRPGRDADGTLVIETAFEGALGYDQKAASGEDALLRQTLHFTLQAAVSDHVYGAFEGRPFFLVAPLMSALEANGRPESLLTSDVAFFPDQGRMRFPGAVLVEMDASLPADQFAAWEGDVLRVNPAITPQNLDQARQMFADAAASGVDITPFQAALASPDGANLSPAAVVDLALGLALARLGSPSLNAAFGQELGAPMGFDGWASEPKHLDGLADYINENIPADGMGLVQVGRHNGTAGDQLYSAVRRSNSTAIDEVIDNPATSPRIRETAKAWQGSEFITQARHTLILDEILNGSDKLTNDYGVERTGLTRTLFGPRGADCFEDPRIGTVERCEVEQALLSAPAEVIAQVKQSLVARGQARLAAEQEPHPADEGLIQFANDNCKKVAVEIKGFSKERLDARRGAQQDALTNAQPKATGSLTTAGP